MEVLQNRKKFLHELEGASDLHSGDIERVEIEWKSLLSLVAFAPPLKVARWQELQVLAREVVGETHAVDHLPELPELLTRQRERFESVGTGAIA